MKTLISALAGLALVLSGALLIQAYIAKPFLIPSKSMAATLKVGDRVIVNRAMPTLRLGEVAVFYAPRGAASEICGDTTTGYGTGKPCAQPTPQRGRSAYIKRIVGAPGDLIAIKNGQLIRNNQPVKESYASSCDDPAVCDMPVPIRVPQGMFFMMGDNRGESADSRVWGPVPQDWLIGEAQAIWWPLNRLSGI